MSGPTGTTRDDTDGSHLFKNAMAGNWEAVIDTYKRDPCLQMSAITKSDETVLHVAISISDQEGEACKLVDLITGFDVLLKKDCEGRTPLHLAAARGSMQICRKILDKASLQPGDETSIGSITHLLEARNKNGETPFFVAALEGHEDVFYFLLDLCLERKDEYDWLRSLCRRYDGDTILHCTIRYEYFDLALYIIEKLEYLADTINVAGFNPLQVQACNPSVFRSGTYLKPFDNLIYKCLWVGEWKQDKNNYEGHNLSDNNEQNLPKNYETCFAFIRLLKTIKKAFVVIVSRNPAGRDLPVQRSTDSNINLGNSKYFPPNYVSIVNFIKFFPKMILFLFRFDFEKIRRVEAEKRKHTRAREVMIALIEIMKPIYSEYGDGIAPINDASTARRILLGDDDLQEHSKIMSKFDAPNLPDRDAFLQTVWTAIDREYGNRTAAHNIPTAQELSEMMSKFYAPNLQDRDVIPKKGLPETPILIAARLGILEMVERIVDIYPLAIHDKDQDGKNAVLLAVENRQTQVYQYLMKTKIMNKSIYEDRDRKGNTALHLAATLPAGDGPWLIPGAALQMQSEIKWFKYIEECMPRKIITSFNNAGETPHEVFIRTHKCLVSEGATWLTSIAGSFSLVAVLIATVAFTMATAIPGVTDLLRRETAFKILAISSLVALSFSVTFLVMFLSILTSRCDVSDFRMDLPWKLIVGLSSLYVSLAAILVSFCASHFLLLGGKAKNAALYAIVSLPVAFFAVAQLPLYVDLMYSTLTKVPFHTIKKASL